MTQNIPTKEKDYAEQNAFFKQFLSDPSQREKFFLRYLPKSILQKIDVKNLKMEHASFVDEEFSQYHSDLLFSAADKTIYVYFLLEHQSSKAYKIAWKLRQYKHRIWKQFERDYPESKFPMIHSVVVYNGKEKYTAAREFSELFADPEEARKVENEEYLRIDLSE